MKTNETKNTGAQRYETPDFETFQVELKAAVMSGEGGSGEGNGEDGEV